MGRNNQQRRRAKAKERTARRRASGEAFFGSGDSRETVGRDAPTPPSERDEAVRLVADVLDAAHVGHADRIEVALGWLGAFSSTPSRRLQVARVLLELLHEWLTWAWNHGWQPADVLRLGGRTLQPAEVGLLGDAIVTDLSHYAEARVDRRWFAQLRQAEAHRWWGIEIDALRARAASTPAGWVGVCEQSARVLSLLATLPPLQMIGPAPGEATRQHVSSAKREDIDERILTKVRQLLAKAESTTFEAEAETFTAGAQAMMARHSIDVAMLETRTDQHSGPQARRIGIDRPYENPKAMLLTVVADANRCRTVWSRELGFMTVLGFEADLSIVETLFTSLLVQSTQALQREGSRRTHAGGSRTRSFRSSFLTSYATRIGERLLEVTQAETASAAGEHSGVHRVVADGADHGVDPAGAGRHAGGELVRVLAQRSSAVDAVVTDLFPHLKRQRVSQPRDLEGWTSGRAAADRAALDVFDRVGSSSRSHAG